MQYYDLDAEGRLRLVSGGSGDGQALNACSLGGTGKIAVVVPDPRPRYGRCSAEADLGERVQEVMRTSFFGSGGGRAEVRLVHPHAMKKGREFAGHRHERLLVTPPFHQAQPPTPQFRGRLAAHE